MKDYKIKFPEGFLWGSATAAEQIEPSKGKILREGQAENNWTRYYKENPNEFYKEQYAVNDFWHKYEEDIKLAKDMNMNSIRIGVSWSKILPTADGPADQEVIEHYKKVFQAVKDNGLELIINGWHFTAPIYVFDDEYFQNRKIVKHYIRFMKVLLENFDEYADRWAAFNESLLIAELVSWKPEQPHKKEWLGVNQGFRSLWHINLCIASFVKLAKDMGIKTPIGSVFIGANVLSRSDSKEDVEATALAEWMVFGLLADASVNGEVNNERIAEMASKGFWDEDIIQEEDLTLIKENRIEWIGLNYYAPKRIQSSTNEGAVDIMANYTDVPFFAEYENENGRYNTSRGWEIHPESLYLRVKTVQKSYGNIPMIITENGMAVEDESDYRDASGLIQDDYRIMFINEHLYWLEKALNEGANVIGYHMWTYIDNWSWRNGYKNRYGFYELDLETLERKPKKSMSWFSKVFSTNEIDVDLDEFGKDIGPQDKKSFY